MSIEKTNFPKILKEWQLHLDLNQKEFAEYLGINIQTMKAYMTGRRTPSDLMVNRMAKKLSLPIPLFLDGPERLSIESIESHRPIAESIGKPLMSDKEISQIALWYWHTLPDHKKEIIIKAYKSIQNQFHSKKEDDTEGGND